MKKITLLLLVLSAFLLTSCLWEDGGESAETTPGTTTLTQELNADSILDNQLYQIAVGNNDVSKCGEILDEAKKKECAQVVQANVITAKAKQEVDVDVCDGIELDRYRGSCVNVVEGIVGAEKRIEKEIEELNQTNESDQEKTVEAMKEKDIQLCEGIIDRNEKKACRISITLSLANESKDIAICDVLEDKNQIETCQDLVRF